ncbi:MAG: N-acetyltransferase [Solobacterium sp.]|nr:N-acetyltransferase [Solobacterium sp.]
MLIKQLQWIQELQRSITAIGLPLDCHFTSVQNEKKYRIFINALRISFRYNECNKRGLYYMEFLYSKDKIWLENEKGEEIAVVEFPEVSDGVVCITHTGVDSSLQGQGIAGKLTQALAEHLRKNSLKADLRCSYAIRWFAKHEDYQDVLHDPETAKKQAEQLAGSACEING